uniref:cholinesterase-like isoform X2 n=1 Tax=Doryrhamphus excisus TaxID=161450 RepID=UPI0025AD9FFC|nr:cholinesterase-like isoform X2 [Doryrhamphus excisus]
MAKRYAYTSCVLLLAFTTLPLSLSMQDDLIVNTSNGKIQGKRLSVLGGDVGAYLGIPYGKPPLGKLRFRAPEPAERWDGVKDTTKYANSCFQVPDEVFPGFRGSEMWNPNTEMSEDCLYLNVWTTFNKTSKSSSLAPVLVWIYGGGFSSGTSSLDMYDGRYLSKAEGVVVVSMNYRSMMLATLLGCPTSSPTHLDMCLQKSDPGTITSKQYEVLKQPSVLTNPFLPLVDGNFLPDEPEVLLQSNDLTKKELLIGLNKDEGTYFLAYGMPGYHITGESLITRKEFMEGVKIAMADFGSVAKEAAIFQYTDWTDQNNRMKNRDSFGSLVGDQLFVCPVLEFAQRYSQYGGKTLLYFFDHRSSINPWPEWMGAMHGFEIEFIFGMPLDTKLGYTRTEVNMTKRFLKHWANFARTGNPGIDGATWPLFTAEHQEYVTLNSNLPETRRMMRAKECYFWNKLIPRIQKISNELVCGAANGITLHYHCKLLLVLLFIRFMFV